MIKVELMETEEGITSLFFSSNTEDPDEIDKLDKLLKLLVSPFPRRGGYNIGAPSPTVKIDVNTRE